MNKNLKIVIGLGKTGFSCVCYLVKHGFNVAVVDSRMQPPYLEELQKKFPKTPIYLGNFSLNVLKQARELIISPGVSLQEHSIVECIKQGINVIGDIELFAFDTKDPVIAITGSNGKSTVTSLVGMMASSSGKKVKVGGNLGTPALDLLDKKTEIYVLELSSFQLETTNSLNPIASVVLNISPDHMDRYQSFNEYLTAKQRIYSGCQIAIVNRDDPVTYSNVSLPKKVISFGLGAPDGNNYGFVDNWLVRGSKRLIEKKELKIKGLHNVANALAALALGEAINLPLESMIKTLREFSGLSHRCQWVANINGIDWYNDSKGTNVGATNSAIEGLGGDGHGKIVLIAGGIGKDADFSALYNVVKKYVRVVVLFGRDAQLIGQTLNGASKILYVTSMADAVAACSIEAISGDKVLLSPACTSFDMFNNFEHRGDVFIQEVKKLKQ